MKNGSKNENKLVLKNINYLKILLFSSDNNYKKMKTKIKFKYKNKLVIY